MNILLVSLIVLFSFFPRPIHVVPVIDTPSPLPSEKITGIYYVATPVLAYHSIAPYAGNETAEQQRFKIEPKILDQQFAYLRDHKYTVIPIEQLIEALRFGTSLPEKTVVLTFDDGTASQYIYAVPLLEKYNYPATFFIYTTVIGKRHFMTWDQVRDLDARGMTIGGHTKTHAYLTKMTDQEKVKDEIVGGKEIIEEQLGHAISSFAYPFYMTNDEVTRVVQEAGYDAAFAGWQKENNSTNTLYSLKRNEPANNLTSFPGLLK